MERRTLLRPLSSLRVSQHQIPANNLTPNTSIQKKPLLIYHSAFEPSQASAPTIESHLTSIGVVEPQWRFSMFPVDHFHSNTHEVLCVCNGKAMLCFGGEGNEERVESEVEKGDVMIVPAGVGHKLLEDLSGGGFEMVGSYPPGEPWNLCYGTEEEREKVDSISGLQWFDKDPIYGDEGPCLEV